MSEIILHERPSLRQPVLIAAFAGWNDAGNAATTAVGHLIATWSATRFAEIQPDEFCDFTTSRPWVRLGEEGRRRIDWPSHAFYAHRDPDGPLDAILFLGIEPALRWRTYAREIVELARSLNVSIAVTLGAYLARASHRDPVPISGWAWPQSLHERLKTVGASPVEYEGPTGIVTVLGSALADANIPIAALWAALPSYLRTAPNPKGALALLTCISRAFGMSLKLDDLALTSKQFERTVDEAIKRTRGEARRSSGRSESEGGQAGAAEKESQPEPSAPAGVPDLPTGEEAIRDIEDFLRQSRDSP
ncbi:MAG: PAC2 family protein [Chloroflexi bacterium]|nr:PAC2 family protein [Chloroflexota bacterium]